MATIIRAGLLPVSPPDRWGHVAAIRFAGATSAVRSRAWPRYR